MIKRILFFCGLLITLNYMVCGAQSLQQGSWKAFFPGNFQDTLTLKFGPDTLVVLSSLGDTLVLSSIAISADTLTLNDISGRAACRSEGVYLYHISGEVLHFTLVSDGCQGRTPITEISWMNTGEGITAQENSSVTPVTSPSSLNHTLWKGFLSAEGDSITLGIGQDTLTGWDGDGQILVQSTVSYSGDTIRITDFSGQYQCAGTGTYLFSISGDQLNFTLVNDVCSTRQTITSIKWMKQQENPEMQ